MGLVLSDLISRFVSNLLPKTRVEVAELTGIDFQRVDPMYRSPLHYRFYIKTESGEFQDRIVYPREIELYRGNDEHAVISITKEVYRNPIFDRLVGPPYNKYRYKIFAPADFPFE